MPYTAPTADQLQAKYPAFADVDDSVVESFIVDANRLVDTTWTEGDYQTAIMLYACHLMTIVGHGTGGDAQVNAQGLAGFKSIRSGQLSLDRGTASDAGDIPAEFVGSLYGQQFWNLLRRNRPGGAVTGGTNVAVPTGTYPAYPDAFWPWIFP